MREDKSDFEAIYEKDVDLLVVEEFHVSEEFRNWFLGQLNERMRDFDGAWRSITNYKGESDVEVSYTDKEGNRVLLLIENKIKEKEQPNQAERYRERGKHYLDNTEADRFMTLIMAPETYLDQEIQNKYDYSLTYESIREFFLESKDSRSQFKAHIIQEGIDHGESGYIKTTDEETTTFWNSYEEMASEYSSLEFSLSGKPASGQTWSHFNPPTIGDEAKIIHKMERGAADLTLLGQADRRGELRNKLDLEADMSIVKTGKSASIRIQVPEIKEPKNPGEKEDELRESFKQIKKLLDWERKNREILKD